MVAARNFSAAFIQAFRRVHRSDGSVCGRALRGGNSLIVPDIEADPDFLPFRDLEQSVRDDVERILSTPFIDSSIAVSGYVYDVHTGAVEQVVAPVGVGVTA